MAILDQALKQLVAENALEFASWLFDADVLAVEMLPVELSADVVIADTLLRVELLDGRLCLLHIEFQGRSSHRPMHWRMLDYMSRMVQQHQLPIRSVVLYLEEGAGRNDSGQHHSSGPDGEITLAWHYHVIRLWQMQAEEILALGRLSLLPLIGFTRFQDPGSTVPEVLTQIRTHPLPERQAQLLGQLLSLLDDEEITAMIDQYLSEEEIEELKHYPFLWKQYQKARSEGLADGRAEGRIKGQAEGRQEGRQEGLIAGKLEKAREAILEALVVRFDPRAADYRRIEMALKNRTVLHQLDEFFVQALKSGTLAEFENALPKNQDE